MEVPEAHVHGSFEISDGEEEFCSCCEEDEGWQDVDELVTKELDGDLDEFSLRMFFKGVSVCQNDEGSSSGLSGIGVVLERSPGIPIVEVQKKLDFYVEDSVAELLALMDGLLEAKNRGVLRVFAFSDCGVVHQQISGAEENEDRLISALGQRILEHASKFEVFLLKLVPPCKLAKSLHLAQEAIGILNPTPEVISKITYCPFPNCSTRLTPSEALHNGDCSSTQSTTNRLVCPDCHRCAYEFCYGCGSEYRDGQKTCQCDYPDAENSEPTIVHSNQDSELWRWESFELPMSTMDAYTEQERSQLALIQRFLAGGFGLSDHNPCQSPPRCSDSFVDTIKDLHQLPWLERFVSLISDNYHDDYTQ